MNITSPYFKQRRVTVPGYVYVLTDAVRPDCCKIGRSKCLQARMSAARTFAPTIRCMATFATDDYVNDEKRIHNVLSDRRILGTEWYTCSIEQACQCCLQVIHGRFQIHIATQYTASILLTVCSIILLMTILSITVLRM